MNLTKNKGLSIAAVFTIIAVYNVIAFVLPFIRSSGFWIGYSFSMLAMLLTAVVSLYALGREGLKSKVYGIPLVSVIWLYLIIQLIAGLIEMAVPLIPYQYGLVVNVVLLGGCLIGLIAVNIGKEEIERIDEKVKEKVFFIKSLHGDVDGLIARTTDESLKKAIKELSDTIRYCDPMSNLQLAAIENRIEVKVASLADSISSTDTAKAICNELQQLFAERNRKCKLLK